jgi:hypothetical protein
MAGDIGPILKACRTPVVGSHQTKERNQMRREAVALIQDIPSAKDIVRRTVAEAERLLAGASEWITTQRTAAA